VNILRDPIPTTVTPANAGVQFVLLSVTPAKAQGARGAGSEPPTTVTPAYAGVQFVGLTVLAKPHGAHWIPAFAGMTGENPLWWEASAEGMHINSMPLTAATPQ